MASSLAAVPGKLLAVVFVTHHSEEAWDTHLSVPAITRLASSLITHISSKSPLEIGQASNFYLAGRVFRRGNA